MNDGTIKVGENVYKVGKNQNGEYEFTNVAKDEGKIVAKTSGELEKKISDYFQFNFFKHNVLTNDYFKLSEEIETFGFEELAKYHPHTYNFGSSDMIKINYKGKGDLHECWVFGKTIEMNTSDKKEIENEIAKYLLENKSNIFKGNKEQLIENIATIIQEKSLEEAEKYYQNLPNENMEVRK